ncbi:PAS domain S-box-containing protein [Noviherbaspirillum suwonense]|uniref:histidine kinase n=2 Tax=Noviherbaspirillum suwonense TaxID=1224511 RepID=A0ABY1QUR3_9BURK|nr:PAS domain S-box-containing protein [Noviherbaspirillum suwonense]
MGTLMCAKNWSSTVLGSPNQWPEILKTSLRLVLTSNHPMFIWWGADLIQFYNDAYRQTMGPERHPSALGQHGRDCWGEIWDIIGPQIDSVMNGGPATWHEDQLVPVTRHGHREDVWWTYAYSPIQDSAGVRGVLVVCNDVTAEHQSKDALKRLNQKLLREAQQREKLNQALVEEVRQREKIEQRQTLQLKIVDALRGLTDANQVAATAFRLLGEYLEVSCIIYAEIDETESVFRIQHAWQQKGLLSLAGVMSGLVEVGAEVMASLRNGHVVTVQDTRTDSRTTRHAPFYERLGTRAFLMTPVLKDQHLVSVMALHQTTPHKWSSSQLPLIEEVAERVWNAIEHAHAQAQRRRAEEMLLQERREESERLRRLFAQAPGFMAILRGPQHVFEFANAAYLRLVGERELLGLSALEALPEVEGQGYFELLDQVYASGNPYSAYDVPLIVQRSDDVDTTQTFVDFVYQPIIEGSGSVTGIFVEGVDATERHAAKVALEASEARLKEGLVAARMVVWDWNLQTGRVTFSENSTNVFGGNRSKMPDVWKSFHPDDLAELTKARIAAISACGEYECIVRFVRPADGSKRWLQIQGKVLCDKDGFAYAIRGVAIDVTARKQAEEALKEADRRKDEFLSMLAHELRNPLAPLSSAAQLLKAVPGNVERVIQTSGIITRQVEHMTSLINDLLDVSRVTTGMVTLDKQVFDVRQVIAESVEQVFPFIQTRAHRLIVQEPLAPMLVEGDRKRLVQVITNLLQNAAKYTPEGGIITVSIALMSHEIAISVRDNGIGIDTALLPYVFELFTQAKRTSDRSQGGLGLGLALVKSLVTLHGGRVTVSSEGTDKGAIFTVYLPVFNTAIDDDFHHEKGVSSSTQGESLRLLVVDDNVDAANALAMFLEAAGHQVAVEHGPISALEQVKTAAYDVFLLDIGLPGMDGNELARRLRLIPQAAHATLIAVTGYGKQYDKETSLAAGFDYYFVKPASPAKLVEVLSKIKPS